MSPPRWHELPHAPSPGQRLCARAALTDGEATLVDLDGFRLLVLREGDDVHAFVNRCSHFGVPLAETQAQLIQIARTSITCNVHYAKFRFSDGACLRGDCDGEGLVPVPVVVDEGGFVVVG